jgi:carboxylesterase type B
VKTLDEARLLPADKLMAVNQQQINNAPYGTFVYGPTIDGGLVPRLPAEILKDPGFSTDVHLMLGHNSNEGLVFVNPNADGTDTADTYIPNLQASLPAIKPEDMVYLNNTLYQVSTYGTGPGQFKDEVRRQAQTAADAGIICNTYALTTSSKSVYLYEYSVNPGYHGEDLEDTFWTKARANIPAGALQDWIASFTLSGVPSSSSGPTFPEYGAGQNILNLKSGKAPIAAVDDIPVERCKQWIDKIFPNVR